MATFAVFAVGFWCGVLGLVGVWVALAADERQKRDGGHDSTEEREHLPPFTAPDPIAEPVYLQLVANSYDPAAGMRTFQPDPFASRPKLTVH